MRINHFKDNNMKTVLNIRVDQELKDKIEEIAYEEGLSTSEYARNILSEYLGFDEEQTFEVERIEFPSEVLIDVSKRFYETNDFILLTTWLFTRHIYKNNDSIEFVSSVKAMLELATTDYKFSNELRFEFVKVLNDINRYLVEPDQEINAFQFSTPNNMYSFNYNLFINEIWRIFNS
jgi:Ribbon-helix-helix protein, copG family